MIRILAITGKNRHPEFPGVPTTEELRYPAMNYQMWIGISGPPKLPSYPILLTYGTKLLKRW
jgi:tripartite-type tricarboxylate transporter receptor subunit TctC